MYGHATMIVLHAETEKGKGRRNMKKLAVELIDRYVFPHGNNKIWLSFGHKDKETKKFTEDIRIDVSKFALRGNEDTDLIDISSAMEGPPHRSTLEQAWHEGFIFALTRAKERLDEGKYTKLRGIERLFREFNIETGEAKKE